ncbi:MAG: PEP-CTERM sorting domain-containing protein [Planctomycetota bacterium]|nr:MAG: PEP-CTERM sorting domain-containing protein [Planctomycetota bacterium]
MRRFLSACCVMACASYAFAGFFDDFESYADTAAMASPGAWGDDQDAGQPPLGVLMNSGGNPGQYMHHPAGETNRHVIAPMFPSDAQPILWEFDFLDDGTSANKRITGGLRDNGGGASLNSILEMGHHNGQPWPEGGGVTVGGYAVRTVFIGGNPGNWVAFDTNPPVVAGWHHFSATIGATSILFELDLFNDGIVDGQRLVTTNDTSGIGYNILRLGGPSDLSSAGGGGGFDNVSIQQIPEPSALALLALGGLAALRRR